MTTSQSLYFRRPQFFFALATVLVCASLFVQSGVAASRAAGVLDSMPHAKKIDRVALSPDGTQVAYIVDGELAVVAASGGTPHVIAVEGKLPLRSAAWSADSKRLAFLADLPGDAPSAQLWTAAPDGSSPMKHAELKGYADDPRFAPDGSKLAVLFIEGMPRAAGPLQPMTPLAGEIDEKIFEQRIAIIDLATDRLTQVTAPDVYVYEYDWTPDSKSWAAILAHGNGDANWWVARLYIVSANSGDMREIYKPKLQLANPRVSPDGKNVAFIEGLMSDAGLTGGEILVVPAAGGATRNLTPNSTSSPSALAWASPDRIAFTQNEDGNSSFGEASIGGGRFRKLWSGEELTGTVTDAWVPSADFSRDGSVAAMVRQSARIPGWEKRRVH